MKADTTIMRAMLAGAAILAGAGASAQELNLYTSREPGLVEPLLAALAQGGAVDNEICLELSFKEREPNDRQVIAHIAESVAFWAPHIDSGAGDLRV